jgi:uncharacterized beta-barrel protein YwiB (DUF1934 family)
MQEYKNHEVASASIFPVDNRKSLDIMHGVMQIHVKLTQFDITENQTAVLADGIADLTGNILRYAEKENPEVHHEIVFEETRIVLKRKADISSVTCLLPDRKGKSRVHSSYGIMELDAILQQYSREADRWTVQYQILDQEGKAVTSQKLVWELKGVHE